MKITKETKFTPGPWFVDHGVPGKPRIFSRADNLIKSMVCACEHGALSRQEHDAALIAAAPEMYEVLQALVEWNTKYPASQTYHSVSEINLIGDLCNEICKNAEKVLKKARVEE